MPGGVCAVLDYDVEHMADYVTEMATRLVFPQASVKPSFRKYVSSILSSTRLPRTTILLGMNYFAKRLNQMGSGAVPDEGEIWRMLTTAMLLGSKFLDDNTFQNKSWSEVSGIPVRDLNALEYEWLAAANWHLYVNLDTSMDYKAWLDNWTEWKLNREQTAARERLAARVPPIVTDVTHPRNSQYASSWHQQQVAEYERLSRAKRNPVAAPAYRPEQATWAYMGWQQAAPLTPPDSGYGTPEYTNSATSANSHYTEWFDRAIVPGSNSSRHYQQPTTYSNGYHHTAGHGSRNSANYFYNHGHSVWEHHNVADCNCGSCVAVYNKPSPPYFPSYSYGQPVVG